VETEADELVEEVDKGPSPTAAPLIVPLVAAEKRGGLRSILSSPIAPL